MKQGIITGLDIGTTKISAVVAEVYQDNINIIGTGVMPAKGIRKGIITCIDDVVQSIKEAIKKAEETAEIRIRSVIAGISGRDIKVINSYGAVGVRGGIITESVVERAIDSAKSVYIPVDRDVLHVLPIEFVVDGHEGIKNPLGLSCTRLEARVNIVTANIAHIDNFQICCEKAGVKVEEIVFTPSAAANAVLSTEEKESGVILVDMGGGTTDIAIFKGGSLRYASVLGVGGLHVTNDISVGLHLNVKEAERLKIAYGTAFCEAVGDNEEIEIFKSTGNRKKIPRKYLVEIIEPRCQEILELVKKEIMLGYGYEIATSGVVLTGGAALLDGIEKYAESVLGLPVRLGMPDNVRGVIKAGLRSPEYSVSLGLIVHETEQIYEESYSEGIIKGLFEKMKSVRKVFADYIQDKNLKKEKKGEHYV